FGHLARRGKEQPKQQLPVVSWIARGKQPRSKCFCTLVGDGIADTSPATLLLILAHHFVLSEFREHSVDLSETDRHEIRGSLLVDLLDLIAGHGTEFQHSQDRKENGRS